MVPQKPGIPRKISLQHVIRRSWPRATATTYAVLCGLWLAICSSVPAAAQSTECQDSLIRFLTQMYLNGSYCTCPAQHQEVVTEPGRVRRSVQYTLPGVAIRQGGPLPDLSQVAIRVWGKVIDGPDGVYALSVQQQASADNAPVFIRHIKDIRRGQEFEITGGPQDRVVLQTRTPYVLSVACTNANLHPEQRLTVQGRACFYLAARS